MRRDEAARRQRHHGDGGWKAATAAETGTRRRGPVTARALIARRDARLAGRPAPGRDAEAAAPQERASVDTVAPGVPCVPGNAWRAGCGRAARLDHRVTTGPPRRAGGSMTGRRRWPASAPGHQLIKIQVVGRVQRRHRMRQSMRLGDTRQRNRGNPGNPCVVSPRYRFPTARTLCVQAARQTRLSSSSSPPDVLAEFERIA